MSNIDKTDPALIALDWGTTSLRAYVLNSTGNVLEKNPHLLVFSRSPIRISMPHSRKSAVRG